jgi:flagellar basal-body rod modification protein FlgD
MNQQFTKMTAMLNSTEAMSTLGKTVEINLGDTTTKGVVEGITRGDNPQIQVNGALYDMERINAVYGE